VKTSTLDLAKFMDRTAVSEFFRILHEHKDENNTVLIDLGGGRGVVRCVLNPDCNLLRTIDSPWDKSENPENG
jgi:hypothetical protein